MENASLTCLVTGGAGFIGSHLLDALLADPSMKEVRVLDNFSSGRREHLAHHEQDPRLKLVVVELLDLEKMAPCFAGVDQVFHLAANPDARWGIDNSRLDLEQETIVTFNVLEAMRRHGVPRILFSSSGTVYGDVGTTVTHETFGPLLPISLYGAGKVASEALISAFCGTFGLAGIIFRFGNVVGERTTHGAIFDFIRQLAKNPNRLNVLGNGSQAKPYVYVRDLADGLLFGKGLCLKLEPGQFDLFNLAPDGATSVRFIASELVRQLGLTDRTQIHFGDGLRGWPGDVAQSRMDSSKLQAAGFALPCDSDGAVRLAISRIINWLPTHLAARDDLRLPPGCVPTATTASQP